VGHGPNSRSGTAGDQPERSITIRPRTANDRYWCLSNLGPSGTKEHARWRLTSGWERSSRGFCPSVSVSSSCRLGTTSCGDGDGRSGKGTRKMKVPGFRLPSWKLPEGLSGWQRLAVVVGLAVVLLATMSVAATARVSASSGRILAGVTGGGVGVGGIAPAEAVAAVKATTEPKLRRGVLVVGGDKRWPVTPAGL